jgi:inorganic pyrophosphatase
LIAICRSEFKKLRHVTKERSSMANCKLHHVKTWADEAVLNVIVETAKGSSNKFRYELEIGSFALGKVLPQGMAFPYDFGFIPSTLGEDGDPLDALVLMDEPAFVGGEPEAPSGSR